MSSSTPGDPHNIFFGLFDLVEFLTYPGIQDYAFKSISCVFSGARFKEAAKSSYFASVFLDLRALGFEMQVWAPRLQVWVDDIIVCTSKFRVCYDSNEVCVIHHVKHKSLHILHKK